MFSSIAKESLCETLLEIVEQSKVSGDSPEVTLQKLETALYEQLSDAQSGY